MADTSPTATARDPDRLSQSRSPTPSGELPNGDGTGADTDLENQAPGYQSKVG